MESNNQFIRCPRCELNYINKKDKMCSVCKKELESAFNPNAELDDIELSLDLDVCPICKVNYIRDDEDICASCQKERDLEKVRNGDDDVEQEDNWDDIEEGAEVENEDELGTMVNITDIDDTDDVLSIPDLDLDMAHEEDIEFDDLVDTVDETEEEKDDDDDDDDFDDDFDDDEEYEDDDDDDDDEEYEDDDDEDDDDRPRNKKSK